MEKKFSAMALSCGFPFLDIDGVFKFPAAARFLRCLHWSTTKKPVLHSIFTVMRRAINDSPPQIKRSAYRLHWTPLRFSKRSAFTATNQLPFGSQRDDSIYPLLQSWAYLVKSKRDAANATPLLLKLNASYQGPFSTVAQAGQFKIRQTDS